jgi:two-component system LytT family response regulator
MGQILLLEDNISCRRHLLEIASKINPTLEFFETSRASEAYNYSISNNISAFLLDIQVEDYSGIELAKRLRQIKKYQFTPIIFITAMPTKEMEAFRKIHCYDYILKPYSEEDVKNVLQKILVDFLDETYKNEAKKLALKFKDFTQLIDMKDIIYVEYFNRRIVIITKEDKIEYMRMPMKKFKPLLDEAYFMQVHQSIIINLNYVEKIEFDSKKIKLNSVKHEVPIGRSFLKEVRGKFNDI